ncbi:hypothetical protein THAOC_33584 [Thalassiosira oceanica]|uniref:Uncharacterized protein n=1 Tax=Thalassiosira oceanica TaxID=159749 RepID=K0RFK6_THAOC|nr:hypothetical protein THAOC_33584 [Thalassiosira oceanica]|eukprot:EJK47681.1 hypothetical protein THAOC_33584 [Thalassiosira oceanica]
MAPPKPEGDEPSQTGGSYHPPQASDAAPGPSAAPPPTPSLPNRRYLQAAMLLCFFRRAAAKQVQRRSIQSSKHFNRVSSRSRHDHSIVTYVRVFFLPPADPVKPCVSQLEKTSALVSLRT